MFVGMKTQGHGKTAAEKNQKLVPKVGPGKVELERCLDLGENCTI